MAAYIVARIDVTNPDDYVKYSSQTVELAAKYGGKFLAKGGPHEYFEGDGPSRIVIVEFEDADAARRWYHSAEYQAIAPIRRANSTGDFALVEGV